MERFLTFVLANRGKKNSIQPRGSADDFAWPLHKNDTYRLAVFPEAFLASRARRRSSKEVGKRPEGVLGWEETPKSRSVTHRKGSLRLLVKGFVVEEGFLRCLRLVKFEKGFNKNK